MQRRKPRILAAIGLTVGAFALPAVAGAADIPRFGSWWEFERDCYEAGGEPKPESFGLFGPPNDCVVVTYPDELAYWVGFMWLGGGDGRVGGDWHVLFSYGDTYPSYGGGGAW